MARLNEPATTLATDSLEVLKRRFLRQNRELAKSNSLQSLKISQLENEVTRLLGENLATREANIRLEKELQQRSTTAPAAILALKAQLQEKLAETSAIIAQFGTEEDLLVKNGPRPRIEPLQRWPAKMSLSAIMQSQEGMLPPIAEDKYYPRRTISSEDDLPRVSDQSQDSPDLGPPPIAHFEQEDLDANDVQTESIPSPSKQEPVKPSNTEKKRRRRESGAVNDLRKSLIIASDAATASDESVQQTEVITRPLKAGSKRKLNACEDESVASTHPEPFEYTKKDSQRPAGGLKKTTVHLKNQASSKSANTQPSRNALGEKSVNLSPTKTLASAKDRKAFRDQNALDVKLRKTRPPPVANIKIKDPPPREEKAESVADTNEPFIATNPKTPAAFEMFSPPSTESSNPNEGRMGTPPPADLGMSSLTTEGRMGRRARAPVNYAEPNLISKMRRPSANMADAVEGARSHKREDGKRTIFIKRENPEPTSWKNLAEDTTTPPRARAGEGSPLSSKLPVMQLVPMSESTNTSDAPAGEYSTLKSAMLKKRQARASSIEQAIEELDNMQIYDFNETSPAKPSASSTPAATTAGAAARTASARVRRHSSASNLGVLPADTLSAARAATERKRLPDLPVDAAENARGGSKGHLKSIRSSAAAPIATVALDVDASTTRADRVASRRRSMML